MEFEEELKGEAQADYGDKYKDHLLEQYKLYIELADRVSQRRINATTTFFASVNTLLLSGYGILASLKLDGTKSDRWLILIACSGILFSISWSSIISSYRHVGKAKLKIIHELEKHLPVKLFNAEWIALEEDKQPKLYITLTRAAKFIPIFFILINLVLFIIGVLGIIRM